MRILTTSSPSSQSQVKSKPQIPKSQIQFRKSHFDSGQTLQFKTEMRQSIKYLSIL